MRALGRKLDLTVTGFNAFRTDPQLRQIRIRSCRPRRADDVRRRQKRQVVSCPDPQLQMALRGVVQRHRPAARAAEARDRRGRRLGGDDRSLPPPDDDVLRPALLQAAAVGRRAARTAEESRPIGREPAGRRVRAAAPSTTKAAGLSKRDYVPLAVAVFVDLCLLLVSIGQRPANRLDGLAPKMKAAERGPVIEILSRFNDIHRDQQIRENFELFRHVVFDMNGDYYVAVPLDAPPTDEPGRARRIARRSPTSRQPVRELRKRKNLQAHDCCRPPAASRSGSGGRVRNSRARNRFAFTSSHKGAWSDIILGAVMGAARRAEAEEDGVRSTRGPDLPKPATRVLPDAQVPKPEAPAPNFERHAASSAPTLVHRSPTRNALRPLRRNVSARSGVATLLRATAYPANTRRAARSRCNGRSRQQQHGANGTDRAAAVPQYDRDRRPDAESATLRAGQRRRKFSISSRAGDGRASRCSARRRLSLCRSAKPPSQTHSKWRWLAPIRIGRTLSGADNRSSRAVPQSRPRPATNRRRASPKTSFLPRTGPLFAASHHRLPNEKCFDRKRDNWVRHKSTRAATLA